MQDGCQIGTVNTFSIVADNEPYSKGSTSTMSITVNYQNDVSIRILCIFLSFELTEKITFYFFFFVLLMSLLRSDKVQLNVIDLGLDSQRIYMHKYLGVLDLCRVSGSDSIHKRKQSLILA